MNGDDQETKTGAGNGEGRISPGNGIQGERGPGEAGASGAPGAGPQGAGPGWTPAYPPGWGGGPGPGGWPVKPEQGGLFRQHPFLMILLILLFAGAVVMIIAAALGSRIGSGSAPAFSFGKKVGVVKVEGIVMESKEVVDQIRRFFDDESVSAVVIRIDSPGGVVGAAQEIHDEVRRLAKEKPVVVSMGSVAASGGYYIACPARRIFASEGTLTGSIGVIMEVANLEGLFEWMKIKNVVIKSGEFKDAGSAYRDMTREEREYLQEIVDNLHRQFENAIAEGRPELTLEKVRELSNGKIYTGVQAKELGLIDEIGTLWDAIAHIQDAMPSRITAS